MAKRRRDGGLKELPTPSADPLDTLTPPSLAACGPPPDAETTLEMLAMPAIVAEEPPADGWEYLSVWLQGGDRWAAGACVCGLQGWELVQAVPEERMGHDDAGAAALMRGYRSFFKRRLA